MASYIINSDELYHHGIEGQKWGIRRFQNPDGTRTAAGKKRERNHPDYNKAHDKKKVNQMSDKELNERNNRLTAEQRYAQLTKKESIGKKAVQNFVKGAGTITAVVAAYGVYKKYGTAAIEKINNLPLSELMPKSYTTLR